MQQNLNNPQPVDQPLREEDIQMNPPEQNPNLQQPIVPPQINNDDPQGIHQNNRAQDNPDPDGQQNPAQALLALQNENLFNRRANVPAEINNTANVLNHLLIAEIMRGNQQEAQRRNSHGQLLDQVNRAVAARNIPPASSGLARSLSAFAKSMLGMDKNRSDVIPSPPTHEEHDIFVNHKNEMQGAIRQYVNNSLDAARQMYGAIDQSAESKIRAAAIKEVKKIIPEVCYQQLPAMTVNSHYFPARWMAHCHRTLARSGIPRCTYEWNENSDSPWNSTIMEVFLDSWGLYQQSSSSNSFRIEAHLNTPENQLGVLQRWLTNTSSEYHRVERLRLLNRDNPNYQVPKRETSKAAKIRVSVCQSFFLLIFTDVFCHKVSKKI